MKRYEPPTPRLAIGIAAVALAALTLTVSMVVPASLDVARDAPPPTAAAAEPYRTEMIVTTTRIEVVATRAPASVSKPVGLASSRRPQQV